MSHPFQKMQESTCSVLIHHNDLSDHKFIIRFGFCVELLLF